MKVPSVANGDKAILDAAYALESGASLNGPITLTGVIVELDSYNNPTIVVGGYTDMPIYCYRLKDSKFVIGATITVTAQSIKNYNGTIEMMDCILDSFTAPSGSGDQGGNTEVPEGDKAILDAAYALGTGESLAGPITLTGVITELDSYNNPTIVIGDYTNMPIYCYRLKDDRFVVGATITVTAQSIKNYNGTIEMMDCTLDSITLPSGGDQGGNSGNQGSYTAPVEGQGYVLTVEQKNLNKTLYFNGQLEDRRFLTTDTKANAIVIYFEAVDGGYHIYVKDTAGNKSYFNLAPYIKDNTTYLSCRLALEATPNCVWTFNETYGSLHAYAEFEGRSDTFFLATYDSWTTISLSASSFMDKIATGNQFPARFVLADGNESGSTQPENPGTGNEGGNSGNEGGNSGNEGGNSGNQGGNTSDAGELNENTEYLIAGVNSKGNIYFNGTLTNGRINATTDVNSAVVVKLESAGAAGEYYIYFMDGNTKTYIGANSAATDNKTSQFILGTEKGADFVWVLDASAKTIISKAFTNRGIATQVASAHDNFSTYATSNFSNAQYATTWLQVAGEDAGNTGNQGGNTQPENPGTGNEGGNSGNQGGNVDVSGSVNYDLSTLCTSTITTTQDLTTADGAVTFKLVADNMAANKSGQIRVYKDKAGVIALAEKASTVTIVANGKDSGNSTVTVFVSNDGVNFTEVGSFTVGSSATNSLDLGGEYSYVKIAAAGMQLQITKIGFTFAD